MKPSIKYIAAGYAALIGAYALAGDASAGTHPTATAAPSARGGRVWCCNGGGDGSPNGRGDSDR